MIRRKRLLVKGKMLDLRRTILRVNFITELPIYITVSEIQDES